MAELQKTPIATSNIVSFSNDFATFKYFIAEALDVLIVR